MRARNALKSLLRRALLRAGYRVEGTRHTPRHLFQPESLRRLEFDDVVCRHMVETPGPWTFLQLGAFDGVSNDPLRRFIARGGWSGVLVEPQPDCARRLRALYQGCDQIQVLEAAVSGEHGQRTLYTLDPAGLPAWASQIAAFDRAHLLRHGEMIPGVAENVRELTVNCITFADALDLLPEGGLDLLQTDVEGADGELLSLFPFDRLKPAIVHWEVKHMTRSEQEAVLERLCGHGYRIARSGDEDMLAVLPSRMAQ